MKAEIREHKGALRLFVNDEIIAALKGICKVVGGGHEEEFMEMEEYVTAKLAEYVDEHLDYFAEII